MTSLENRPRTALLVIDVQNGDIGKAYERDRVIANIATLVDRARAEDVPVLWVQHSDDESCRGAPRTGSTSPELERWTPSPWSTRRYGDSFEATDLEERLAERTVGRLVVTGAQTEECIRSTLHGALVRGYDATLVSDAHTTEDLREWGFPVTPEQSIAYTNAYWSWAAAPGRQGQRGAHRGGRLLGGVSLRAHHPRGRAFFSRLFQPIAAVARKKSAPTTASQKRPLMTAPARVMTSQTTSSSPRKRSTGTSRRR